MILPYIEDYLAVMAGLRDIKGNQASYWPAPVIQLAAYDVGFVSSVASAVTDQGIALTVKQATLTSLIIAKYSKQLFQLGVDQPNHSNYRYPLRTVVSSNSLTLENDKFYFRFPYNEKLITDVKQFKQTAQGEVAWGNTAKAWVFTQTEYNLSWVYTMAQIQKAEISEEVRELFKLLLEVEKNPKDIVLRVLNNKNVIENVPNSLDDYIRSSVGYDNLIKLVDHSGMLAFDVCDQIKTDIQNEYGNQFLELCLNRQTEKGSQSNLSIDDIVTYATATDRFPICVYDPRVITPDTLEFEKHFDIDEMQVIQVSAKSIANKTIEPNMNAKVIFMTTVPKFETRIPLLVSYVSLLIGSAKTNLLDRSEKVIFNCHQLR